MDLLSFTATFLILVLVTGHDKTVTDGETEINLPWQSKVNKLGEVRGDGLDKFLGREEGGGKDLDQIPLCGRTQVTTTPINRAEDLVNSDDDNSYDEMEDDQELDKIYGGSAVTYGEIPWQVQILYYTFYQCTGVIISEFWVLTAAHCVR
ncbi:hypothetical protein BsWGS_19421 [Bradybaena similaris]